MLSVGVLKEPKLLELSSDIVMYVLIDDDTPGARVSVPEKKMSQLVTTLLESCSDLEETSSCEA